MNSIVLITVDCLRADHVGFMGHRRATTPFLDTLARESFAFPTAIVAGAPTYYSFPSILASRHPLALGRDVLGLAPDELSLASVLKGAGYATAAFSAGNPYLAERFGYHQGFDVFEDFLSSDLSHGKGSDIDGAGTEDPTSGQTPGGWASALNRRLQALRPAMGPLRPVYDELYFRYCQRVTQSPRSFDDLRRFPAADVLVARACAWLASIEDSPFFLWLHFMDPHAPYYPKAEALEWMGHAPIQAARARYLNSYWNRSDLGPARLMRHRNEIMDLYDAGIRWMDAQVSRLVEALRTAGRWDQCVLALTADHGEEFLDHGGRFHPPSCVGEELIRVPLILRIPGETKKAVSASPFSLLHLTPTLLDAAQVPWQAPFQGRSQWSAIQKARDFDGPAITECIGRATNPFRPESRLGARVLSARETRYKLVLRFEPYSEELYDLEQDCEERRPLPASTQKPIRRRLLEAAREHLRQSVSGRDDRARLRARLREVQLKWAASSCRSADSMAVGSQPRLAS